jgi:hypothetical protein
MEGSFTESWNPVRQSSHTEKFLLVVAMEGLTIGPIMSADQNKQIGIRRGATSFNMRTVFIKSKMEILKNHRS